MAQIMRLESVDDFFDDKPPTVQPKNASSVLPEKILKVPDVKPSEAGPHHDNDDDGNDISTIPLNVSEEKLGEENKKVASKESEVDTQQSLTAGDYEDANVEHQKENQEPPASEASGEDEWESDDEGSKEESVSEEQEASEEEASGEEEEEEKGYFAFFKFCVVFSSLFLLVNKRDAILINYNLRSIFLRLQK